MTLIKKYSNRRLYDTEHSRYITLDELAQKIREGEDVRIVDAKSGNDLTQATLTQLILEGPGAGLLPVDLLHRLIRMQDDALAEFFSKYISNALDLYLAARDGAQTMAPYFPFAGPMEAFMRMFAAGRDAPPRPQPPRPEPSGEDRSTSDDVAELRRELDALRQEIRTKT